MFNALFRANGATFSVPAANVSQDLDICNGNVVTIEYEMLSPKEVPVEAKIIKIRADMTWEDVLQDFENDSQGMSRSLLSNLIRSQWLAYLISNDSSRSMNDSATSGNSSKSLRKVETWTLFCQRRGTLSPEIKW